MLYDLFTKISNCAPSVLARSRKRHYHPSRLQFALMTQQILLKSDLIHTPLGVFSCSARDADAEHYQAQSSRQSRDSRAFGFQIIDYEHIARSTSDTSLYDAVLMWTLRRDELWHSTARRPMPAQQLSRLLIDPPAMPILMHSLPARKATQKSVVILLLQRPIRLRSEARDPTPQLLISKSGKTIWPHTLETTLNLKRVTCPKLRDRRLTSNSFVLLANRPLEGYRTSDCYLAPHNKASQLNFITMS